MANVAKVVTIIGSSPESFAKAADAAVREAAKTLRGITGAQVVSMSAEVPGLLQSVLPGRRVDDEQRLVRRPCELALDHAPHLRQFLHQVRLCVQSAGGIDDDDVASVARRPLDRVVGDRSRIRSTLRA